jgi:hypothetical protein
VSTLVVAATRREADEILSGLALKQASDPEYPNTAIGVGGALYGARYEKILIKGPITVDHKVFEWITRELLCRLRHDGEVRMI